MPARKLTPEEKLARRNMMAARQAEKKSLQSSENGVLSEKATPQQQDSPGPAMGSIRSDTDRQKQRRRGVFSGNTQKLAVIGDIPGYVLHIFNDDPGRIDTAMSGGWEFVQKGEVQLAMSNKVLDHNADVGGRYKWNVGKNEDGSPQSAFLMKIKKEFYDEDKALEQGQIDQREAQMVDRGGIDTDKIGRAVIPRDRETALSLQNTGGRR